MSEGHIACPHCADERRKRWMGYLPIITEPERRKYVIPIKPEQQLLVDELPPYSVIEIYKGKEYHDPVLIRLKENVQQPKRFTTDPPLKDLTEWALNLWGCKQLTQWCKNKSALISDPTLIPNLSPSELDWLLEEDNQMLLWNLCGRVAAGKSITSADLKPNSIPIIVPSDKPPPPTSKRRK